MAPSLYAPPKTDLASVASVDVDVKEPLPPVCLKCARTKDVRPRPETLHVVTPRARLVVIGVAIVAVGIMTFFDSTEVRVAALVGIVVAGRVLRMGVRPVIPKVDVGLPMCPGCDERWTSGVRRRRILRGLVFACVVLMLAAIAIAQSPFAGMPFLVIAIPLSIANALVRIRERVVVATGLKGDVVTLSLVHPDAVAAINERRLRVSSVGPSVPVS